MSDIKKQVELHDTFYDVLDFLIEINSHWMSDRMKSAFSHSEYFTEMSKLKGYDAQRVITVIMRKFDYKIQFHDAGSPKTDKKDKRRKINTAIDKFEKALNIMYGNFDDPRIPDHAHIIKEQLKKMKLSMETKDTYENKLLYGRRPKTIVTLLDIIAIYDQISETHDIIIPHYRAKQLYDSMLTL